MRLLTCTNAGDFSLKHFADDAVIPPYAILSHTWGLDSDEVTFQDLVNNTAREKLGFCKIELCGQQARQDNLEYFWIDTCCIDKENYAELSHAINSMFRWYRHSSRCYVYMTDVLSGSHSMTLPISDAPSWEVEFRKSRWFTRGWTLQELLAPTSVEFFSREWTKLGDNKSLRQLCHEATGIPFSALEGLTLYNFSVNDRVSWTESRQTQLEEDKAYCLLGILGVYIPPIYGEGTNGAFKRLFKEIEKSERCIQDLRLTDPRSDKIRIEDTKGGLLVDSYCWILDNPGFRQWREQQVSQLFWIRGDPGKGKTMLLCGIVDELNKSMARTEHLSYFFCQAADLHTNNATAVLRGLIYLLVIQQPTMISHIWKKYSHAGKRLFEDTNAWVALSEILNAILQDPKLESTYLAIDALDECISDLPKLLQFIIRNSDVSSRVKWVVSSRNWPDIEQRMDQISHKAMLSLELNAQSIATAVGIFIDKKFAQIAWEKKYDDSTREAVLSHLTSNANDTFLWVSLVCEEIAKLPKWSVKKKLNAFPPGLDALYERMMQQVNSLSDADLCKDILALVTIVYRPVTIYELTSLVEELEDMSDDIGALKDIVRLCGSFLTIRGDTVYFVHQSMKDFLLEKVFDDLFPSGKGHVHYNIFFKSLQTLDTTLKRDVFNLKEPGYPIERVECPKPDPLAASRYSCIYWIDHLLEGFPIGSTDHAVTLQEDGIVGVFVKTRFLYWLEALSLCKVLSKGLKDVDKLKTLVQERANSPALTGLIHDAYRFTMYYRDVIERNPLQAYVSALLFSPTRSHIRNNFWKDAPDWISIKPSMHEYWGSCLQTFETRETSIIDGVAAFSHESILLAGSSAKGTVEIWDLNSKLCLHTLKSNFSPGQAVIFSSNSTRLALESRNTIQVWETKSGDLKSTIEIDEAYVRGLVFSHDATQLAICDIHGEILIWNVNNDIQQRILQAHHYDKDVECNAYSIDFPHDFSCCAVGYADGTIKIWDVLSGICQSTLSHGCAVHYLAFSPDRSRLASAAPNGTVKLWDPNSGAHLYTLPGHTHSIWSLVFSHDSEMLATASRNGTVNVWNKSGVCSKRLEGHRKSVYSFVFSYDSKRLLSSSFDKTVKNWDLGYKSLSLSDAETRWHEAQLLSFSPDMNRLASRCSEEIMIWDVRSGAHVQTLSIPKGPVYCLSFSHDSTRLATTSQKGLARIHDIDTGAFWQYDSIDALPIFCVKFDSTDSQSYTLHNHIGMTLQDLSEAGSTFMRREIPDQHFYAVISDDGSWVLHNGQNILWLPSEFRREQSSGQSLVHVNNVAITNSLGKIWFIEVSRSHIGPLELEVETG